MLKIQNQLSCSSDFIVKNRFDVDFGGAENRLLCIEFNLFNPTKTETLSTNIQIKCLHSGGKKQNCIQI